MAGIVIDLNKQDGAQLIADALRKKVKSGMKMAVVECMRQLTISTPVDTGRARWGWFCTVNVPSAELPPKGQYPVPDITMRTDIGSFSVSDTLYITNNVPYIKRLNNGYSRQAPKRFVEIAAARTQLTVNRYLNADRS